MTAPRWRGSGRKPPAAAGIALAAVLAGSPGPGHAQEAPAKDGHPPVGRAAVEALVHPPLEFDAPEAREHEVAGVPVFHLHDPALPLVDVFVQLRGGSAHFPREDAPALLAMPTLLRTGGAGGLAPDSVDQRIDLLALQLTLGSGGGGAFASLNSLTGTLDEGLELLADLLLRPGFDADAVEVWLGQERERARRREDDPTSLAFAEFNRLLFGDHAVGWVIEAAELTPDAVARERLERLHGRIFCRENLLVGISGDLTWEGAEARIARFVEGWPACPEPLAEPAIPLLRDGRAVFVLPRPVEQATVIVGGPAGLRQEDSGDYFASRIANMILGAGGFTSRLFARVRTERGLAYSASSVWTTPIRHEGIAAAVTATRPERTVEALGLVLEILEELRERPPDPEEVERAVEQIANGYVFAFESAGQIVGRRMGDRAQELPDGWLERFLEGIQAVTPADVHRVVDRHLRPDRMTILVVGDPDRIGPGLEAFGPVYRLRTDGTYEPWG